MNINTDINILGGLLDLDLISNILNIKTENTSATVCNLSDTKIKSTKTLQRYEKAIKKTLIYFNDSEVKDLFVTVFTKESLSEGCLGILFLNASLNNDLLNYLNQNVFFPAYFSGRISIRKDEIIACIRDLRENEKGIKKWTDSTIDTLASKYLTLLKKFSLLEGSANKSIIHKYIDDKQLVLFIYWLTKIETKANILESKWLAYCLMDKESFVQRVLQKKLMKYINVLYSGDSLKLETIISYKDIYNELTKS